jgi:hypothetical protein
MNHLFQECKTGAFSEYGEIEQTISPQVLDKMSTWILNSKIQSLEFNWDFIYLLD